jgi:hypothetical protein
MFSDYGLTLLVPAAGSASPAPPSSSPSSSCSSASSAQTDPDFLQHKNNYLVINKVRCFGR